MTTTLAESFTDEDFEFNLDPFAEIKEEAEVTRYLYALRAVGEKIDKHKEMIEKEIEQIRFWRTKRTDGLLKQKAFIEGKLQAYLSMSGQKSISTPAGRIGFRKKNTFKWEPDDVLIEQSKRLGIPLRMATSPNKTAIKEYLEQDPGVARHFGQKMSSDKNFGVKLEERSPEINTNADADLPW